MIDNFLKAGLLQFGVFGKQETPFKLNFQLLPSYPHILQEIAQKTLPVVQGMDRLLCEASAVPLGVAISLASNIPLVYSLGTDQAGVYDLIGAYDVGHPAALILHQWDDAKHPALIEKAARVGLEIKHIVTLFDFGQPADYEITPIFNFETVIRDLAARGVIPQMQADTVIAWNQKRHNF